jgi:amino acid adenylation domain-containing protein
MLSVQLPEWNRTEVDYRRSSTIADLFQAQAALTPDAIAVIANDRRLSYREVDRRSNRLAHHLQSLGVKPEALVGVFLGRSENLVIAILAILKAGGAYVPLDPKYPQDRISMVIEDSGMRMLLTSSETRAHVPLNPSQVTVLDIDDPDIARESSLSLASSAVAGNLAYVIYTSGSTGKPKGVMVEHRNVVNFFIGMNRAIGSEPGVWLAVTSIAFDISVLELLWTLTRGFKVVIHGGESTDTIASEISRHGVTHLQMTPSLARMLTLDSGAHSAFARLKQIQLGGEALPASLIARLREVFSGELYNMYGPTETTIWSTTYLVTKIADTVPIGHPIANTQIYVLDAHRKRVPTGETGELFIAGDGVARGYWGRPDLTAERFLSLPSVSLNRLYRTGDLARILPDGNVEFLGRTDDQIKLRGHRIEPGEIEAVIEQCSGVRQAVVVAREDREGDRRLVAYVVAESVGTEAALLLKSSLMAKLPEPMIPSAFVFLSALPLTENGKINRLALLNLPPPVLAVTSGLSQSQSESASEIESVVSKVWQEALGVEQVGQNDNFFDLGAHSLTVAEVQSKLQSALSREISIVDLFQFSTISSLSRHLAGTQPLAEETSMSDRAQRRRLARQR